MSRAIRVMIYIIVAYLAINFLYYYFWSTRCKTCMHYKRSTACANCKWRSNYERSDGTFKP